MRAVFADTFYWVALTNPADPYYRDVMARQDEIADASIFTTDAVLSEFLTFFAGDKRLRNRAGRTVEALLEDPDIGCSGATGQKVALRTVLCNLFHRPAL